MVIREPEKFYFCNRTGLVLVVTTKIDEERAHTVRDDFEYEVRFLGDITPLPKEHTAMEAVINKCSAEFKLFLYNNDLILLDEIELGILTVNANKYE